MNKVKIGFFSFTEITDPKEHHSYNEWHQLDHVPENIALPGIAHGQRWASPPAYAKARMASDPSIAPIHYMTLYLLQEPIERTLKDFLDLGAQLDAVGRFHRHRKGYLGGPFLLVKAYASPRVLVSPEAIPYRPNRGIFVTVTDLVETSRHDEIAQWYDQVHFPDMLSVAGMAGVYRFISPRASESEHFAQANPPGRFINVYYLDDDPLEVMGALGGKMSQWRAQGRMLDMEGAVKRIFMGPLKTITPWEWDWFDREG